MASLFSQLLNTIGLGGSASGASATSTSANGSTGVALALQVTNTAFLSGADQVLIAAPGGATVTGLQNNPNVIIGNTGIDHLTGGKDADVIIGGAGTNVMSGGGGTDIFGHVAGAVDYITDFSSSAEEKIALAHGLSLSGSTETNVIPSTIGLSGTAPVASELLTFNDGSTVTLVGSTEHPSASWFI